MPAATQPPGGFPDGAALPADLPSGPPCRPGGQQPPPRGLSEVLLSERLDSAVLVGARPPAFPPQQPRRPPWIPLCPAGPLHPYPSFPKNPESPPRGRRWKDAAILHCRCTKTPFPTSLHRRRVSRRMGAAGKPIAIIGRIRCLADQVDAEPTLESAKKSQTHETTPPLNQALHPSACRKTRKPQHAPPARWALPRRHHSPADTRRAAGPRRPAPQEAGTPPMITAAHSGGRRRCLCFQHPHDTAFRSNRQGVRSFGIFSRGLELAARLDAVHRAAESSYWFRARFRNCSASSAGISRPTSPMPAVGTPMNNPASSKAAPPLLPSLMSASVLM